MSSSIDVARLSVKLITCVVPFQMHIYRSLTGQLGHHKYIAPQHFTPTKPNPLYHTRLHQLRYSRGSGTPQQLGRHSHLTTSSTTT
jgi:hypothetical protein